MIEIHGTLNYQRLAETWAALIAAREGLEIVPGSVSVELKGDIHGICAVNTTEHCPGGIRKLREEVKERECN